MIWLVRTCSYWDRKKGPSYQVFSLIPEGGGMKSKESDCIYDVVALLSLYCGCMLVMQQVIWFDD